MNSTVKTVLIVGGVAVAVVLLFKMLTPTPAQAANKAAGGPQGTEILSMNGILSLGAAALGAFGGSSGGSHSSSAAVMDTGSGLMATRDEWINIGAYNDQPGTQYGIAGLDY